MKLFASPTSPYARKVLAVIIEKGLQHSVEVIPTNPLEDGAKLQAANPLGKVPTLLLDDGRVIVDSSVIGAWLDTIGPGRRLIPEASDARLDTLVREAIADGMMDAIFALVMERRRPLVQRSPEWIARWIASIRRSVAMHEASPPMSGEPDLADLALAVALAQIDFRLPDIDWSIEAPKLRAWLTKVSKRPSLAGTAPPTA